MCWFQENKPKAKKTCFCCKKANDDGYPKKEKRCWCISKEEKHKPTVIDPCPNWNTRRFWVQLVKNLKYLWRNYRSVTVPHITITQHSWGMMFVYNLCMYCYGWLGKTLKRQNCSIGSSKRYLVVRNETNKIFIQLFKYFVTHQNTRKIIILHGIKSFNVCNPCCMNSLPPTRCFE